MACAVCLCVYARVCTEPNRSCSPHPPWAWPWAAGGTQARGKKDTRPQRKLPEFSSASEALWIQTVAFGAKNMQQKERNINKAKCHQCLPTYRHRPFVCSEMGTGSSGKYSAIHTTVLSSCSADDIPPVAFPFNLERGKERKRRTWKSLQRAALQRGHPFVNALRGSRL